MANIGDLRNLIYQTIFVRILDPTLVAHFCSSAPKEGKFPGQNNHNNIETLEEVDIVEQKLSFLNLMLITLTQV